MPKPTRERMNWPRESRPALYSSYSSLTVMCRLLRTAVVPANQAGPAKTSGSTRSAAARPAIPETGLLPGEGDLDAERVTAGASASPPPREVALELVLGVGGAVCQERRTRAPLAAAARPGDECQAAAVPADDADGEVG